MSSVDNGTIEIGNRVFINRNFSVVSREIVQIGEYYFGLKYKDDLGYNVGKVIIGNHCWIGTGVIILRGTTIGDSCEIGADSVIKHDIPT